jgi:arylsulfatase A-like enzyme/Tfp pilus assembly protein PilF
MISIKKPKLIIFFFLFLIISGFLVFSPKKSNKKKSIRYNVILITIDTLRTDRVSLYNNRYVNTPNIDSIGEDGIVFKNAFANVPVTLPSHTGIMTGLYPPSHQVRDNIGYRVSEKNTTLAELLKSNGYKTGAVIGAFPLDSRFGLNQGFDFYDDYFQTNQRNFGSFIERKAAKVINKSIAFIRKQNNNKFFLWLHIFDPHQPYNPPKQYSSKFKNDLYSGEVKYVDDQLGKLFGFLKKNNLYKKTIIIITADHGEGLGDHGEMTHAYFAYNSTIHIPLIIYVPKIKHKTTIKDYVSHIDIFPTVCDLLGIKKPKNLEGESLFDYIEKGKKSLKRRFIYFESLPPNLNRDWAPLFGIIDTKTHLKFIDLPIKEIYDLNKDFNEKNNIYNKTDKKKELSKALKQLMLKLGKTEKSSSIHLKTRDIKKLESLGYFGNLRINRKKVYTKRDDLKILLSIQNEMLEGFKLFYEGKTRKAINILKKIVNKKPEFILVWNKIAEIYIYNRQYLLAFQIMEKALKKNPLSYGLLLNYGQLLSDYGDPQKAIKLLGKAKKIYSNDPNLWNSLGTSYWKIGEINKALNAFDKALKLDNNFAVVYNNIASMYLNLRFYDKAEENYKKALSINPVLSSALNGYGALLKKRGKTKEAIKLWKKCIEYDTNYYMAYYNLLVAYIENSNYKEAEKLYNRIIKKFKNNLPVSDLNQLDKIYYELKYYLNQ